MSFEHRTVQHGLRQLRATGYTGAVYLGGRPAYLYASLRRAPRSRRPVEGAGHGA
jgi:hypothetical protein